MVEPSTSHMIELPQGDSEAEDASILRTIANVYAAARVQAERSTSETESDAVLPDGVVAFAGRVEARSGALGFYQFCRHAERWGITRDGTDLSLANVILEDEAVRAFLFDLYGIEDEYRDRHLVLHATGTTSFILKSLFVQNRYIRAIKIIKPWFLADPDIAAQTSEAREAYLRRRTQLGHPADEREDPTNQITPGVEFSNRHCIIMGFVYGETLRDYFARLWTDPPEPSGRHGEVREDRNAALNEIMLSLCGVLDECHRAGIHHGDLSTTNILVTNTMSARPEVRLIDFGINYLLTRNLGYVEHAPSVIATIDPDVMRRKYEAVPTIESDVYSLGMIMVEGFLGKKYRVAGVSVLLDDVYERHPGFGAILDDLLDPRPERRLLDVPNRADAYQHISRRIDDEFRARSTLAIEESGNRIQDVGEAVGTFFPAARDFARMIKRRFRPGDSPPNVLAPQPRAPLTMRTTERLDLFIPWVLNGAIVGFVLTQLPSWDAAVQGEIRVADTLRDHWPAWIVALAGSLVAHRYFMSIFAGEKPAGLPRILELSTSLCAFAPWIPLMLIVRYPDDWLLLVALSGTVVVVNTWLWFWFARHARRTIERPDRGRATGPEIRASPMMDETAFSLRGWTETSTITLICVYAVAYLTAQDILQDITFYALLIAGVVCMRVLFANLRSDAPKVRTGLQRLSNGYRRARVGARVGERRPADDASSTS
jgi:hypothetical protein